MQLSISTANIDDLHLVKHLAHIIWPHTFQSILSTEQIAYMLDLMYHPEVLRQQVVSGRCTFLLLYADNVPVGFAAYELNFNQQSSAKLHKIYLLPRMQGQGAGKFLMNAVVAAARQHQQRSLYLNVNRHNNAVKFYEHYGFSIIREEDIDIGNGFFMNDYIMEFPL
jgi:GNAT superfamily N-acetyltransferase